MASKQITVKRECSVRCGKLVWAKGLCEDHYYRARKHGSPLAGRTARGALTDWVKGAASQETDNCILWPFSTNKEGYGFVTHEGRKTSAHRLALILASGLDPKDMFAAHGPCHNPLCCNPRHLSWKTPKENSGDRYRDNTISVKLTLAQVAAIRRSTQKQVDIAADFGICQSYVSAIRRGESWEWAAIKRASDLTDGRY